MQFVATYQELMNVYVQLGQNHNQAADAKYLIQQFYHVVPNGHVKEMKNVFHYQSPIMHKIVCVCAEGDIGEMESAAGI